MRIIIFTLIITFLGGGQTWAQSEPPVTDVEAGARIEKIDDDMRSCGDVWATMKAEVGWVKGEKLPPGAVDKAIRLENWWGLYFYTCLGAMEGIKQLRQDLIDRKYLETQ